MQEQITEKKEEVKVKKMTLNIVLNKILPSLQMLLNKKLSFREKLKLAEVVKDLNNKKDVYEQCMSDYLKENCELDEKGVPKMVVNPNDPNDTHYVYKPNHNEITFLCYQTSLLTEECNVLPYLISESMLEQAFKGSDPKEQTKLDEDLGRVLPTLMDFIMKPTTEN